MSKVLHIRKFRYLSRKKSEKARSCCNLIGSVGDFITRKKLVEARLNGTCPSNICKICLESDAFKIWTASHIIDMTFEDLMRIYGKSLQELLSDLKWVNDFMSTRSIRHEIDYYYNRGIITEEQKGLLLLQLL